MNFLDKKYKFVLLICFVVFTFGLSAQQVNTIYFMDNVPIRHHLNPSFKPKQHLYISFPVIGFTQFSFGNNSVSLKDVIYNYKGATVTALDGVGGDKNKLYRKLNSSSVINTNVELNLVSIGLNHKDAFWNFTLTEKFHTHIGIPKDVFKLILFGTPDLLGNRFGHTTLETDATLYTEAALGYAKTLDEKWTIGAKLKYLYGTANFSNENKYLDLTLGIDKYTIDGKGSINYSSPLNVTLSDDFKTMSYTLPKKQSDWLKRSGSGAGIDFGVTYKASNELTLSVAFVDIGFINWKRNALNVNFSTNFTFDGIGIIDSINTISGAQDAFDKFGNGTIISDSIVNAFKAASKYGNSKNNYYTATPSTLNFGAEYSIIDNKLTVGILSRTQLYKKIITEEITTSINAKPVEWFNASISTSLFAGRLSSIGSAFGLETGIVHWFLAADYIPFQKSTIYGIPLPYTTEMFNFAFGVNLVFDQPERKEGLHKQKSKKGCLTCK